MCCRKHRVNGPCCTMWSQDPTQTEFFINETCSLMNQVSFGTVISCIGNEVQENVSRFGQNHRVSIFWVHLGTFDLLTILKLPQMCCYISTLMKHIDVTINFIN